MLGNMYYFCNELRGGEADSVIAYGKADDVVLSGDWDGDGVDTLAVRRGNTYYFKNSIAGGEADVVIAYGKASDEVLVGDWDGDGVDTLAVRRGNLFYVKNSIAGGEADKVVGYGKATDTVLVGDWDGDGRDSFAVRRNNMYYIKDTIASGEADRVVAYGRASDDVYVGDWDNDGADTLAVRRANTYYLANTIKSGEADVVFAYGRATDSVLVGDWDGDGVDTFCVRRPASSSSSSSSSSATERKPGDLSQYISDEDPIDLTFTSYVLQADNLGTGWASNSVNAASFRQSAVVSAKRGDETIQTVAYYDEEGYIILARRNVTTDSEWEIVKTPYQGQVTDAHNVISIGIDGDGYLHMAWSMHGQSMQYVRSVEPWSLELGSLQSVTGKYESSVTYPQFFTLSNGDMFLLYRDGSSGYGNAVLDRYDVSTQTWTLVNADLIDGKSADLSPYWQAAVDSQDRLHISWVWRTNADVSSNHDIMYARSTDSTGETWETSDGTALPSSITVDTAEVVAQIPEGSSLMNQTSMTVDDDDNPYIVNYWADASDSSTPVQYHVLYNNDGTWHDLDTGIRTTYFDLSGGGTRSIPIARPQIAVSGSGDDAVVSLIIRDAERDSVASIATSRVSDNSWTVYDLTNESLDRWEPLYDTTLWKLEGELDVFVMNVTQVSSEQLACYPAQNVYIVRVAPSALEPQISESGQQGTGDDTSVTTLNDKSTTVVTIDEDTRSVS